jgi:hypothetical protein
VSQPGLQRNSPLDPFHHSTSRSPPGEKILTATPPLKREECPSRFFSKSEPNAIYALDFLAVEKPARLRELNIGTRIIRFQHFNGGYPMSSKRDPETELSLGEWVIIALFTILFIVSLLSINFTGPTQEPLRDRKDIHWIFGGKK